MYWMGLKQSGSSWTWSNGDVFSFSNWGYLAPYGNGNLGLMILEANPNKVGIHRNWEDTAGAWNDQTDPSSIEGGLGHYGIAEVPLSYFSVIDVSITEGDSGNVTISRTGGSKTAQTLTLTSSNGTATAGSDYTAINQTISFAKGETSKTVSISTIEDTTVENNETFTLTLTPSTTDDVPAQITDGSAIVTITDDDVAVTNKKQKVYTQASKVTYKPGSDVALPLLYTTENGEKNLSGLTLNVHYDSSSLTPVGDNGVSKILPAAIQTVALVDDSQNLDNNSNTDKIIRLAWASFTSAFPGVELPAAAATVTFTTSSTSKDPITGETYSTTVNYSASATASNYDFITGSTTLEVQTFNLDVDGDGQVTAFGDGLMIMRKLMEAFPGEALTDKAISDNAIRSTNEIHQFIEDGIASKALDIDEDEQVTAFGDGLMIMRHLMEAFPGQALIDKAIGSNSPYYPSNWQAVATNIENLMVG